eukprot:357531-Chlamydomonas_euryale.AAC.2
MGFRFGELKNPKRVWSVCKTPKPEKGMERLQNQMLQFRGFLPSAEVSCCMVAKKNVFAGATVGQGMMAVHDLGGPLNPHLEVEVLVVDRVVVEIGDWQHATALREVWAGVGKCGWRTWRGGRGVVSLATTSQVRGFHPHSHAPSQGQGRPALPPALRPPPPKKKNIPHPHPHPRPHPCPTPFFALCNPPPLPQGAYLICCMENIERFCRVLHTPRDGLLVVQRESDVLRSQAVQV